MYSSSLFGDVVAYLKYTFGGSYKLCGGLFEDVVTHLEMWWLFGRYGDSFGDVVL